jgi:hypothetical protein
MRIAPATPGDPEYPDVGKYVNREPAATSRVWAV